MAFTGLRSNAGGVAVSGMGVVASTMEPPPAPPSEGGITDEPVSGSAGMPVSMFIEDVDVSEVLVAASCAAPSEERASVEPHAHKAPRHTSHAFLMGLFMPCRRTSCNARGLSLIVICVEPEE